MLAKAGLEPSALCCGVHWPLSQAAAHALARAGSASALHNNCSGKHAGFLAIARARGVDCTGYCQPDHPVQRDVHSVLEDLTGAVLPPGRRAVDGCSVPTWAVPLQSLAYAFAKFATGQSLSSDRARAAARLRAACTNQPWYVAGTGRFGTEVVRLLGERIFFKTGAEGVACGALPTLGMGFAIKCDDGGGRAGEAVAAALIARLLPLTDTERCALAPFAQPTLRNWNGIDVGALRVTEAL
jgi:L-asparaginase II